MTSLAGKLQQGIANCSYGMPLVPEIQGATSLRRLRITFTRRLVRRKGRRQRKRATTEAPQPFHAADLNAGTTKLVTLTQELQKEVSKSTAGTLSVGVFNKSAQVAKLAHDLKERLSRMTLESVSEPAR